jgi:hypothetical protein
MKGILCAGLMLSVQGLPAVQGPFLNIELTGLLEIGSSRVACFKIPGEDKGFTLHPGEEVAGLLLKQIDAKGGWAIFERGTNQFKVRLSTYSAAPAPLSTNLPPPVGRPPRSPTLLSAPTDVASGENTAVPGGASDSDPAGSQAALPSSTNPLLMNLSAGKMPGPSDPSTLPGSDASLAANRNQASASSAPATAPNFSQVQAPNGMQNGSQVSGSSDTSTRLPGAALQSATDSPAQASSADPANQPLSPAEARRQEGERIRFLYGTAGFLAWDVAQGPLD